MLEAILLGVLQGITEWLPVSSEGVVAVAYTLVYDRPLDEAVAFALWLHLGTVLSALWAFRSEVFSLLREAVTLPRRPSPLLVFVLIATAVSAPIGFPLLLFLGEVSGWLGAGAMGLVGGLMLVTGVTLLRTGAPGERARDTARPLDAAAAGIAQGLAALPGLSRSGLTVAALLARRMQRREALALSFLISIPVTLGAAVYSGIKTQAVVSLESLAAGAAAFLVGIATINVLLKVAERINFGVFVLGMGLLFLASAIVQAWV